MAQKKLLAILASPHENGMNAQMLRCAADAARRAGWHVDWVWLYEKQIAYCIGCRKCVITGECIRKDDLQEIAGMLRTCDVVAVAAPTYWANVPAILKNLFDRLLGAAMDDEALIPKPKLRKSQKYLLMTACNTPFPFSALAGQSGGALRAMAEFFRTAGMRQRKRIVCPGVKGKTVLPASVERRIQACWPNANGSSQEL